MDHYSSACSTPDKFAVQRPRSRVGQPGSRATIRAYCAQVFKQARIWDRLQKSVRVAEFTFPGDPSRLDFSYHRNGTRGYVHTLSVTRAPQDAKSLSYNVKHIADKARHPTEFAAITDVALSGDNDRHRFVMDTLREVGVESVPMKGWPSGSPSCDLRCCNEGFHPESIEPARNSFLMALPFLL